MAFKDIVDIILPKITIPDKSYGEHITVTDDKIRRVQIFKNIEQLNGGMVDIKYGVYNCKGIKTAGKRICDFYMMAKSEKGIRVHGGVDLNYSGNCSEIDYISPNIHSPIDGTVVKVGGADNSVYILDKDKKYLHILRHLFLIKTNFLPYNEKIKQNKKIDENKGRLSERFISNDIFALTNLEIEIKKGENIGCMGGTGFGDINKYEPNVHYEIRKYKENILIDPITFWDNNKKERYFSFLDSENLSRDKSGSNVKMGTEKEDKVSGGEKDDLLQGGAGNDILDGGKGFDAYIFGTLGSGTETINDGKDTIVDSDGKGQVIINSCQIGLNTEKISETKYKETIGKLNIEYELQEDKDYKNKKILIVKYGNGGQIKITDFYENKLMIRLNTTKKEEKKEKIDKENGIKENKDGNKKEIEADLKKIDPSATIGLRVCSGAELKCIAGGATCKIDGNHGVLVCGKEIITIDENTKKNIPGFKTCKFKKNDPCTFAPAGEWIGGDPGYLIDRKATVIDKSILLCSLGGVIEVVNPGQSKVWYGMPKATIESIDRKTEKKKIDALDKMYENRDSNKKVLNEYKNAVKREIEFGHTISRIYIDIIRVMENDKYIFGKLYFDGQLIGESVEEKTETVDKNRYKKPEGEYKVRIDKGNTGYTMVGSGIRLYNGSRIGDLKSNCIMVGKEKNIDTKNHTLLKGNAINDLNDKVNKKIKEFKENEAEILIKVSAANIVVQWELMYSQTYKVMDMRPRSIGYEIIAMNKGVKAREVKKDEGIIETLDKIGKDMKYDIASSFVGDAVLLANDRLWGWHLNRNEKNRTVDIKTACRENWILLPALKSVFHKVGEGNRKNLKFISPDGYSEVVYKEKDGHLKIVTDMKNYGTYNHFPPGKAEDKARERWKDDGMHLIGDILPYYAFGCGGYEMYNYRERYVASLAPIASIFGDVCIPNYMVIYELKLLTQLGKFDREEYELLKELYKRQYRKEYNSLVEKGYRFSINRGDKD